MPIYIGIALVVVGLVIFAIALFRGRRKLPTEELAAKDDEVIQRAFEVIDAVPQSESLAAELLTQNDVELRLANVFDQLFARQQIDAAQKIGSILVDYAPDMAGAHTRMGVALLKAGKLENAAKAFKEAIKIDPTDVRAINNLGYIYNNQKRYYDAVQVLEPALSDKNKNIVTLINLGIAYYHTGNVDRSFELLNAAYKRNPKVPEVHLYIGNCLKAFGETEKAQKAYQRYLVLSGKKKFSSAEQQTESKRSVQDVDEPETLDNAQTTDEKKQPPQNHTTEEPIAEDNDT